MILLSELSRRRIRSVNKLIRVGRNECVVVIRVDQDKGKDLWVCSVRKSDFHALSRLHRFIETSSLHKRLDRLRRTVRKSESRQLDFEARR